MGIEIGFCDPYIPIVPSREADADRLPLSILDHDEHSHVHGTLWIRVNGQDVPALGYLGADDACLGTWAAELVAATRKLRSADPSTYVYDECEQGQPAFVFHRMGPLVRVSLATSQTGDGAAFSAWAEQTCELAAFVSEVESFLASLDAAVRSASAEGANWLAAQLERASDPSGTTAAG